MLYMFIIIQNLADEAVLQARKNMEEFHEEYRNLEVEEKLLDKNFKKEFNDVPAVIADHLYKLFKRKPRYSLCIFNLSFKVFYADRWQDGNKILCG